MEEAFPYLYTTLFLVFVYSMSKLEIVQSARNVVAIKHRKICSLINMVRTQYKNIFIIFWVCLSIIVKNAYLKLLQALNKTVVKIDKNTYEVTYVINGVRYVMHIKSKKGPKTLIQALDQDDNDITDVMQAYLGPMENFHGDMYTPEFFGKNAITLSLSSGKELTFNGTDYIWLN